MWKKYDSNAIDRHSSKENYAKKDPLYHSVSEV